MHSPDMLTCGVGCALRFATLVGLATRVRVCMCARLYVCACVCVLQDAFVQIGRFEGFHTLWRGVTPTLYVACRLSIVVFNQPAHAALTPY